MKKKIFIIIIALVFFIGGTYALIRKNVFNQNAGFSISDLGAYIIYNKGTDVLTGNLSDTDTYYHALLHLSIIYKNKSVFSTLSKEAPTPFVFLKNTALIAGRCFAVSNLTNSHSVDFFDRRNLPRMITLMQSGRSRIIEFFYRLKSSVMPCRFFISRLT